MAEPTRIQATLLGGPRDGETKIVYAVEHQIPTTITFGKPAEDIQAEMELLARIGHMSWGAYRLTGEIRDGRLVYQWNEQDDGAPNGPGSGLR